jgi:serralysin
MACASWDASRSRLHSPWPRGGWTSAPACGDRGNDTESAGAGADICHSSQGAGVDKVLDFNLSQGDQLRLDPRMTNALSQVGADAVIDVGGVNEVILVGVQLSSLKGAWIFGA